MCSGQEDVKCRDVQLIRGMIKKRIKKPKSSERKRIMHNKKLKTQNGNTKNNQRTMIQSYE